MTIKNIIKEENIENELLEIIDKFHKRGPIDSYLLEKLSYIKHFHPTIFNKYESRLMYIMGLFYKITPPTSFIEEIYSIYSDVIKDSTGKKYTPMQADAYKNIKDKSYFSFSAPTSSGKSFLFRDLIKETDGDIVIVVPSRALISEYIFEILDILKLDKDVLVMQFVELVNLKHTKRRIYVITPERGNDLFANIEKLNIKLFLFDESQLSEEEIRGMRFDALVRRINIYFPDSTKVFAHPFVENPEAQLTKHDFITNSSSANYTQNVVGKIYSCIDKNNNFYYFSPFEMPRELIPVNTDIIKDILNNNGTLLIYTSKTSIYSKEYLKTFKKYTDLCSKTQDEEALNLVDELKQYLGVTATKSRKYSQMIKLMERGIVIHHGSIPLKARLIIEKFVNTGYAKICFATSTLTQGINMPFDVVLIENFLFNGETDELKLLEMKNLIGRAGRTTKNVNNFDYGYVIIHKSNINKFINRLKGSARISDFSRLDSNIEAIEEDFQDIAEAIKHNSFDNELRITEKQKNRINEALDDVDISNKLKFLLDTFLPDGKPIKGEKYNILTDTQKRKIKDIYKEIYTLHMRRKRLGTGEQAILSATIPILLWRIQGKTFKEIVSIRFDFLSENKQQQEIKKLYKQNLITYEECYSRIENLKIHYSTKFALIPNIKATNRPLFDTNKTIENIDYDILIWDTYDYIDKIISWALADPLSATFHLYYQKTKDERALAMSNFIKYGTNDNTEIWLMKYGFDFEDIEWIKQYIVSIDDNEIVFNSKITELSEQKRELIERYVNTIVG